MFDITVTNTNRAPTVDPIADQTVAETDPLTLTITGSDPDLTIPSLTVTGLPAWAGFTDNGNGTGTLKGTPTNANLGSNAVTLRVEDASGAAVEQSFTINVDNTNDAPSFTSTAVTVATEDQVYTYSITTSDPDVGDTRDITALSKPSWLTLTDNGDGTAVLEGTPLNANVGSASVVLSVTDALGASANQSFTITVSNTNDAPVFTSNAVTAALQDIEYSYNVIDGQGGSTPQTATITITAGS